MIHARANENAPGFQRARGGGAAIFAALACLLLAPAAALGAPPQVSSTSVSGVTETAATLAGKIDTQVKKTEYRFDYITRGDYEADKNTFGTGTISLPSPEESLPPHPTATGSLEAGKVIVKNLIVKTGALDVGQAISGTGIPPGTTIATLGSGQLELSQAATGTSKVTLTATGPQPVSVQLSGLEPGTAYLFRLTAHSSEGPSEGPSVGFATLSPPPIFGSCPNDPFRLGQFAPLGQPSSFLPDCRAYEQATPLDKDGGDALGVPKFVKAADDGNAVTYGSNFGMPGGEGAQVLPFFVARRGEEGAGWSSQGLLPAAEAGDKARFLVGWLPDLSLTLSLATRLGTPRTQALFAQEAGQPARRISAYEPVGDINLFTSAGASADGQELAVEATTALPAGPDETEPIPGSVEGDSLTGVSTSSNVYAWDREANRMHLASTMNTLAETEALLPKGANAGPYEWVEPGGKGGGARSLYYLQEERAVSADGSIFFSAVGSGQLYERLNPTEPQSPLNGQGECTDPALACTIHISGSEREPSDPQGAAPAALQAASADGHTAYFTSSEELTNSANTGPEQPPAQIGRAKIGATEPEENKEDFLSAHAAGIAVSPDHEYIYWVDPVSHSIGRAKLNGEGKPTAEEPNFIEPPEGECKVEVRTTPEENEITGKVYLPGPLRPIPSIPRYVAVDGEYIYWTNSGLADKEDFGQGGLSRAGSIGRAKLDGTEVKPTFICGAGDPQGIAVDKEHIYWANAQAFDLNVPGSTISRADRASGANIEYSFVSIGTSYSPYGLAIGGDHLYYGIQSNGSPQFVGVQKARLSDGEHDGFLGIPGTGVVSGLATDAGSVYWVGPQGIGRADLALDEASREPSYLDPAGTAFGLATDEGRLYYSVNGESPPNPGNDLYRYTRAADGEGNHLSDLTPDSTDPNGAEVQGVLGASEDGSIVYFVANADLDGAGEAQPGDCHWQGSIERTKGQCNLYRWQEGQSTFLARLDPGDDVGEVSVWTPRGESAGASPKKSMVSRDGETLEVLSALPLAGIPAAGKQQLYRFRGGEVKCVSCPPSGEAPLAEPSFSRLKYPVIGPRTSEGAMVAPRFLSADGNRAFFDTTEALVSADTNADSCKDVAGLSSCLDVYEWEAPGTGSCEEGAPGYSPLNGGCIYLISTGKSAYPSVFADASESGNDVFFFTRDQLVGQDSDQIQDVYDARVGGGLAAQNPQPAVPCEAEGCKPAATPPLSFSAPPSFSGPPNPAPKRCGKGKVLKNGRCVKKKGGGKKKDRGHHKKKGARR